MKEDYSGVVGILYFGEYEKFALIKNLKTGNVTFPGGGRDEDENDPMVTLQRELLEETGLTKEHYEVTDTGMVHEFTYNSRKKGRFGQRGRNLVYLVKVDTMDLRPKEGTTKTFGWFDKNDVARKLTFLDFANIFRHIMALIS